MGLVGPGEIINWIGYLSGYCVRRIVAKTYMKILVLKSNMIDKKLVNDRGSFEYFQKLAARAADACKMDKHLQDTYKRFYIE